MKIGTDALLLGAYPKDIQYNDQVLEIGCGCGIISIMTRHKYPEAYFHCIDIDKDATSECQYNVNLNGLNNLKVYHSDVLDYANGFPKSYQVIISNPPYFSSELVPGNKRKELSKHTTTLSLVQLAASVNKLLVENGLFYVVLPVIESKVLAKEMEKQDFTLVEKMEVKSFGDKAVIRVIMVFCKNKLLQNTILKQLTIYNSSTNRNDWTSDYKQLLQDFKEFN